MLVLFVKQLWFEIMILSCRECVRDNVIIDRPSPRASSIVEGPLVDHIVVSHPVVTFHATPPSFGDRVRACWTVGGGVSMTFRLAHNLSVMNRFLMSRFQEKRSQKNDN